MTDKTYADLTPEDFPDNAGNDICVVCGDLDATENLMLCECCSNYACEDHFNADSSLCSECAEESDD